MQSNFIDKIYKPKMVIWHIAILMICLLFAIVHKWLQRGTPFVADTFLVWGFYFLYIEGIFWFASTYTYHIKQKFESNPVKIAFPALLIFWLGVFLIATLVLTLATFLWYLYLRMDLHQFVHNMIFLELKFMVKSLAIWSLLISIAFFFVLWTQALQRERKLKEEKLIFQYETLKNQINPHFLFNSLNTLSSLIDNTSELADKFIGKLSTIYRYVLENTEVETIDLQSEIEFVKNYFYLQQIRDENKISLQILLEEHKRFKILPMSLQLLVENALKHNSATREVPLHITISIESDEYITVKNNLKKKETIESSNKIGLKNLGERIRLITGKEMIVLETKEAFMVKIPLIPA